MSKLRLSHSKGHRAGQQGPGFGAAKPSTEATAALLRCPCLRTRLLSGKFKANVQFLLQISHACPAPGLPGESKCRSQPGSGWQASASDQAWPARPPGQGSWLRPHTRQTHNRDAGAPGTLQ